jgi:type VI secretion system secreted protein VgrG
MDLRDIALDAFSRPFSQENRELRLRFSGQLGEVFDGVLLPQRLEGSEGICEGMTLHLACVTNRLDMPAEQLIGVPIEVQQVTDQGDLRRWCVVIDDVRKGQPDGSLMVMHLTGRDVFAIMRRRRSHRRFLDKSVLQIAREVLDGWRKESPALGYAFDYAFVGMDEAKYPTRALVIQTHQSDTEFLDSLLRRDGISWFFRAGADGSGDTPAQQLVMFDDARMLPANSAGPIRYHRRDGTEPRDTVNLLALAHTLSPGSVQHFSWDHEAASVAEAGERTIVNQGDAGNQLAAALRDTRIELPHAGDDSDDHQRLARIAMLRHEMKAQCLHGVGGMRAQSVGEYNRIDDFPALSGVPDEQREYIPVRLEHWVENNLPKALNEYAQALLTQGDASGWMNPPPPNTLQSADRADRPDATAAGGQRHVTRFTAVQRDAPFAPAWDPAADLPLMPLMTATVVSNTDGEPIWCDDLGRVKVRIHGLQRGADDTSPAWDTAWVRVNFLWCGPGFGVIFPLRAGMEVSIGFEMGDPSRPMIVGSRYNAVNPPPRFDHLGNLPANRALSGIVTRELQGQRQQQLRFNDTPGHISVQLASDHGATQLNMGDLGTPMNQGRNEPRGEGAELSTDAQIALRGLGVLISSAIGRQAAGKQLDRAEAISLSQALQALATHLGTLAQTHEAETTDTTRFGQLVTHLQDLHKGSNIAPGEPGGGAPIVAVSAVAGAAILSQDNVVLGAQTNVDIASAGNTQLSAGKRLLLRCSDVFSTFSHGTMKLISRLNLLLASHEGDVYIQGRRVFIDATDGIYFRGPVIQQTAQGAQVDVGNGQITQQSTGAHVIKSASFAQVGPGGGSPPGLNLPNSVANFDQQICLRESNTGEPMPNQPYRVTPDDGAPFDGRTDAAGMTQRFPIPLAFGSYSIAPLDD